MTDRKELDAQLAQLNAEVQAVLALRKAWMDAHMVDYAEFKVGDELYDLNTGALLGSVVELYRYWARDPKFDDSMNISYAYRRDGGVTDNTSRQIGLSFGTKEQAYRRLAWRLDPGASYAKAFGVEP